MTAEHEIGRIVAVDTAEVTVELNRDLKALTRSTYEQTAEVGRINSYIIIPAGARRIVAMVTRVVMTEESKLQADKTMVSLPSSRRLMKATMIGTIDDDKFEQGISVFPVLDSKVYLTSKDDLRAIFGGMREPPALDPDKPGYCITIGKSAIFSEYDICVDPDAFFGKHVAVIGSTGSGKSCSIATILQSIFASENIRQTRFIILDTNGEYRQAFQQQTENGVSEHSTHISQALYIPTDNSDSRLTIPYWFMNSDDFARLFRAAPKVQRPVLMSALSAARMSASSNEDWLQLRTRLIHDSRRILALSSSDKYYAASDIYDLCDGVIRHLGRDKISPQIEQLTDEYPDLTLDGLLKVFETIKKTVRKGIKKAGTDHEKFAAIDADKRYVIELQCGRLLYVLSSLPDAVNSIDAATSDRPSYFSKQSFRYEHLENAMSIESTDSARTRENCSTLLMRIYQLLEDDRYSFLFGPTSGEWPQIRHGLAAFLRDILGANPMEGAKLTGTKELDKGLLPFYDRQRSGSIASGVVIVDLSLLASEVLENVTALIGRLIHEFLQRLSETAVSRVGRGDFPVVLVLEEAQNYIKERRNAEEESISKQVFERIAREGRKYGLGLVVASQRPSELSKTVLSQCNSFLVHRLQNPEDLRYFREIVPGIYDQLLDQLPALSAQTALVLGECVKAPALVRMRDANPMPKSKNPKFYKSWTGDEVTPDFEAVCAKWEGVSTEQR